MRPKPLSCSNNHKRKVYPPEAIDFYFRFRRCRLIGLRKKIFTLMDLARDQVAMKSTCHKICSIMTLIGLGVNSQSKRLWSIIEVAWSYRFCVMKASLLFGNLGFWGGKITTIPTYWTGRTTISFVRGIWMTYAFTTWQSMINLSLPCIGNFQ